VESEPVRTLRRAMLGLVVLGTIGLCVELIVLEHYADWNQLIPLAVSCLGLLAGLWTLLVPGLAAVRAWQFTMLLFIGTGITGITMHFDLRSETVNPPLLAPALFVQLGLLGLLYTYRHPATGDTTDTDV
jgi:peptidoglycan/LPS O-acetylase OafA/YrhL